MTLSETAGSDADTIAAPATDSALPGGGHPATAYPPVPRMAGVTDGDYRTGRCECGRRSHAPTGRAASSTTRPPVPGRSADTATTRPPARVCGVCVSRPRRQTTIPSLHGPGHPEPVAGQSPPRVHTPTPTIVRAGACCGDTCSATGGQPSKRSRPPLELGGGSYGQCNFRGFGGCHAEWIPVLEVGAAGLVRPGVWGTPPRQAAQDPHGTR